MRRAYAVLLVIGASALAACIIGPKQDDPADFEVLPGLDAGATVSDTSAGGSDTGLAAADTETPPQNGDGDARADGDAPEVDGDAPEVDGDAASDSAEGG